MNNQNVEKSVVFFINDQEFYAAPGETILNAATAEQYQIPSICYHPSLGSIQN